MCFMVSRPSLQSWHRSFPLMQSLPICRWENGDSFCVNLQDHNHFWFLQLSLCQPFVADFISLKDYYTNSLHFETAPFLELSLSPGPGGCVWISSTLFLTWSVPIFNWSFCTRRRSLITSHSWIIALVTVFVYASSQSYRFFILCGCALPLDEAQALTFWTGV